MALSLVTRIEKLEKATPTINPFAHLSDEELQAEIDRIAAELEQNCCPDCPGCKSPVECGDLALKVREAEDLLKKISSDH